MESCFRILVICIFLFFAMFAPVLHAQDYMTDATLVSSADKTVTLQSSGQGDKKKTAELMALKSALYTLLYNGVDGVNDGKPLLLTRDKNYEGRLFADNRYTIFIGENERVGRCEKLPTGNYRAKMQLVVFYEAFRRDAMKVAGGSTSNIIKNTAYQPTLTVVPFARSGQNVRTLLERNKMLSHSVSKLTSEFSKNGYRTKDFISMVQNAKNADVTTYGSKNDAVSLMIQNLSTDIVVTAKVEYIPRPKKQGEVSIELNATEKQTATTLASSTFLSGCYMTTDSVRLADYAISKIQKEFFSTLQTAFKEILQSGRELSIQMVLDRNIDDWDFDQPSPASGEDFKAEFENWLMANTKNGMYDMDRSSDKIIVLRARIPVVDESTGKAYTISNFRNILFKFLNERLNGEYSASIVTMGQGLVVTIK